MKTISKIIVTALGLLLAAYILPGIEVSGFYIALIVALILGLLNLIVRPILLVLTFPITIITFGLFSFIINAFLFWFAGSFIDGFVVAGFLAALVGSLFISVINIIGEKVMDTLD